MVYDLTSDFRNLPARSNQNQKNQQETSQETPQATSSDNTQDPQHRRHDDNTGRGGGGGRGRGGGGRGGGDRGGPQNQSTASTESPVRPYVVTEAIA
mgnify:CR=1 FL=1